MIEFKFVDVADAQTGLHLYPIEPITPEQLKEAKADLETRLNKLCFVLCKHKNCFPEHDKTGHGVVVVCNNVEAVIGDVNWD